MNVKFQFLNEVPPFRDNKFSIQEVKSLIQQIQGQIIEFPIVPQLGMLVNISSFLDHFEILDENILVWDWMKNDIEPLKARIVNVEIDKNFLILFVHLSEGKIDIKVENPILSRLIDDSEFNLSARSIANLQSFDIVTIGDLVRLRKGDITMIRNIGKKSAKEIQDLVLSLNLHFGYSD